LTRARESQLPSGRPDDLRNSDEADSVIAQSPMRASQTFFAIAGIVLPVVTGVGLAYWLLTAVLERQIDLGRVQRIIEIARHLDETRPQHPWTVFVGDSIPREGIDAEIVQQASPGEAHVSNFAISGFDISEHKIFLPRILDAQPDVVVMSLSLSVGCTIRHLDMDKAYAYALAGYVDYWPPDWKVDSFAATSEQSDKALRSSRLEQYLYFRTAPVNSFDHNLRLQLRGDLRPDYIADFVRPHEYTRPINRRALEQHMAKVRKTYSHCVPGRDDRRLAGYNDLIDLIASAGAFPVVMVVPIHPELRGGARDFLAHAEGFLAPALARTGGAFFDLRDLLDEGEFIDATHPNETGRAHLSRIIGQRLRTL
jgi:hypothetical protein